MFTGSCHFSSHNRLPHATILRCRRHKTRTSIARPTWGGYVATSETGTRLSGVDSRTCRWGVVGHWLSIFEKSSCGPLCNLDNIDIPVYFSVNFSQNVIYPLILIQVTWHRNYHDNNTYNNNTLFVTILTCCWDVCAEQAKTRHVAHAWSSCTSHEIWH